MAIGGTNLDVNGIVGQLMSLEQRPIASLNKKEADFQARISAYGNLSSALSTFQTSVQELSKPEKFKTIKATSSDAAVATASASDKATPGSHTLSISSIAQAQKLATEGQESDDANIGSGEPTKITFDFGTIKDGSLDADNGKYKDAKFTPSGRGARTLTIDSSNNTLQGIRDAINAAKIGITASIVNDGSDSPYVLSLSSENAGASNSMRISVTGDEAIRNLLAHDPASATQNLKQNMAAQNARFTIDGVTINKDDNSIAEVVPGLSLKLLTTSDKPVTLTIANDGSAITTAVQGFVKSYNEFNKTLQDLTAYNAEAKKGAVLQGDSTARLLQSQLRTLMNTPVKNGGIYTTLSQIGIAIQKDGSMTVDTSKLNAAITENSADVARLFTSVGKATDPMISFSSAGRSTSAGSYPVNITRHATQGSLGGCEEIETRVIEEGENDKLNVVVDGVSASVTLAPGTYSFEDLANEIQAKINGAPRMIETGAGVSVKHDEYGMIMTSKSFGSKSTLSASGNAALNLFGEKPVRKNGLDVAGTINGIEATGSGQILSAKDGNASGIKVVVKGGPLGERGAISYSQGYAQTLNQYITAVLARDGQLESRKAGINNSIKDIGNRRDNLQQKLPLQEARYRKQYSTLETMLSNMGKTSNYLAQQLGRLPKS